MKNILAIVIVFFALNTYAQKEFKSTILNPDQRIATLRNDTLWVHLDTASFRGIKPVIKEKRTFTYNDINYSFAVVIIDPSLFWAERNKGGLEIYKNRTLSR